MIHVYFHNTNIPEKTYACKVLLSEILGLSYTIHTGKEYSDYTFEFENKTKIILRDTFFSEYSEPYSYLCKQALPKNPQFYIDNNLKDSIPVLYGTPSVLFESNSCITCSIDIIASAFFMLSRWEECVHSNRDIEGRFPTNMSYGYTHALLSKPIVHIYAELIRVFAGRLGTEVPVIHNFTKTITHDIDYLYKWNSVSDAVKTCVGDIAKRFSVKLCVKNLRNYIRGNDPYNTIKKLMDLSEKHGYTSHFYVLFSNENKKCFKTKAAQDLFATIKTRGHTFGMHFNHFLIDDVQKMKNDCKEFETLFQQKPHTSRQHFLRFQYPETFQALSMCGIQEDSSLYYREALGFRTGMCIQHSVFDIHLRATLSIQESPLICMDVTLRDYTSIIKAEQELNQILETTKRYHGNFVCLWHNSSFDEFEWEQYEHLYLNILSF